MSTISLQLVVEGLFCYEIHRAAAKDHITREDIAVSMV